MDRSTLLHGSLKCRCRFDFHIQPVRRARRTTARRWCRPRIASRLVQPRRSQTFSIPCVHASLGHHLRPLRQGVDKRASRTLQRATRPAQRGHVPNCHRQRATIAVTFGAEAGARPLCGVDSDRRARRSTARRARRGVGTRGAASTVLGLEAGINGALRARYKRLRAPDLPGCRHREPAGASALPNWTPGGIDRSKPSPLRAALAWSSRRSGSVAPNSNH
jgi:hypothetical protein